jgi:hypothetical protein
MDLSGTQKYTMRRSAQNLLCYNSLKPLAGDAKNTAAAALSTCLVSIENSAFWLR